MKYHPDKNSSNESTQKFQKLNEAYQTLGDQEKRSQYDLMQQNPFMKMGTGMHPFSGACPIDEILKNNDISSVEELIKTTLKAV